MEYLPNDPYELEIKNIEQNEKKLKEFREFLVDKGIVLAFVKVLLSLKYSDNKPKNPLKAIREFFGKYKDPQWDEQEALKEKIIIYNEENPRLMDKVLELEEKLETIKRNKRFNILFMQYELDKNGQLGTKQIIEKLTGNKKFEVDEKLLLQDFIKLIEKITEENKDTESIILTFLEKSCQGHLVFKDDQENNYYKMIVNNIRDLKKPKK